MSLSATEAAPSGSVPAARLRDALGEVLGSPGRLAGFAVISAVVALAYSLLLPFDYTQRFELANWHYLNGGLLAWSIVLGVGMGLVASVQVYAMRRIARARAAAGTAGGVAFVASLLPSFLCCTPIIPTVLAFVGVSGVGLYGTTGTLQHFFAVHQTQFLAASLALLVVTGWWGLHKIATAACLSDGCAVGIAAPAARAAADRPGVKEGALQCASPDRSPVPGRTETDAKLSSPPDGGGGAGASVPVGSQCSLSLGRSSGCTTPTDHPGRPPRHSPRRPLRSANRHRQARSPPCRVRPSTSHR